MNRIITYKGITYKMEECWRTGFTVYEVHFSNARYIGRSIADNARKAIIDALCSSYSAYY